MAKQQKSPPKPAQKKISDEGGCFVPHKLASVNPLREQFEPTPAEPMRQRYKMAGGC